MNKALNYTKTNVIMDPLINFRTKTLVTNAASSRQSSYRIPRQKSLSKSRLEDANEANLLLSANQSEQPF